MPGAVRALLTGAAICVIGAGAAPSCAPSATEITAEPPAGIIILGGMLNHFVESAGRNQTVPPDRRTAGGIALAKRYPDVRVYYAGLENPPGPVPWLLAAGVPSDRITWEPHSRTTAENARFAVPILRPRPGQRWLLITSGFHILRAEVCFRIAGFDVEPHPVADPPIDGWDLIRRLRHEWTGLAYYVATGRCRPDPETRQAGSTR